jgi:hypothetical protein
MDTVVTALIVNVGWSVVSRGRDGCEPVSELILRMLGGGKILFLEICRAIASSSNSGCPFLSMPPHAIVEVKVISTEAVNRF